MWPTSTAFSEALAASTRTWRHRIEVLYAGDVVTSINVLADGYVNVDSTAVRRSAYLTLIDADGTLTPSSARDLLAPKGTEVRLYKGLLVAGAYEEVPLGVFGVVEPEVSSHSNGTTLKLKGWDRVDAIRVRQFSEPYTVAAGTPTATAISNIITSRLDVPIRTTATGNTTPESVFDWASDPWDAITTLADSDGLVAYFDPLGTCVVEPEHETMTGIVYAGGDGGLLETVQSRTITADKTYSGVVVKGEHPEAGAVWSTIWDTDPTSPTYADGPFGHRPYGFYSKLIDTQEKADSAAATLFAKVTKMRQKLVITTVGTPGHEIGDVVRVIDPASKTNGYYKVVSAQIQIRPGATRLSLEEATNA
jgi:hypothetical protein